jgi:hypothetical protein
MDKVIWTVLVSGISVVCSGGTLHVPADHEEIQAAIDAAIQSSSRNSLVASAIECCRSGRKLFFQNCLQRN